MWWCFSGALVLVLAAGCDRTSDAAEPPAGGPPIPVEIATVLPSTLRESSDYLGTLRSRRSVRVQPLAEGWITDIAVESGARVQPGTLLMRIDARRQIAAVRGESATRTARAAELAYQRQQYRRMQQLLSSGGASRQELEQARSALVAAEAAVAGQTQQVRAAQVELRYHAVTAPEAGTVGDIPVRVGDLVTPETLLTTIDQNDVLEAYVGVPAERIPRLHLGLPVEIRDRPDGAPTVTRISFVAPRVSGAQTVLVKTKVANPANRLRNGQVIRARVLWSERQGPAVPVLAVQLLNGQYFVWTVREAPDGGLLAEQRAVYVGPILGQVHPVLEGLAVGERVVVAGMQKLRPGARVAPARPVRPDEREVP